MCKFFSFVTDGNRKKYYFDWEARKELLTNNPFDLDPDSHTSICKKYGLNDDKVNKYEYNPLIQEFTCDQTNIKDDSALAKKWVHKLDLKTVVEPLIIKPIIHPFSIDPPKITEKHIALLKKWAPLRVSVGTSVWTSVWASAGTSVCASIWDYVRDSVYGSVRDSVWGYVSSFFILEKWEYIENEKPFLNPFQSCVDLWEQGIVPSFDGKIWRLHTKNGIVFEITKDKLNEN